MNTNNLDKYLLEAVGLEQSEISDDNPYKVIGFDGGKKRLGWVVPSEFDKVKEALDNLSGVLEGKKNFIFIGMGGSINGIKPLLNLIKDSNIYTLDSLDPLALLEITKKIDNLSETLVISISKSGGTLETQLLTRALKEVFINTLGQDKWQDNFLWLSDSESFEKLDSLGWQGTKKTCIQFNQEPDVGGRFSAPLTLIFNLPLFLLLNKDINELEKKYTTFVSLNSKIIDEARLACEQAKEKDKAYFSISIEDELSESFSSWVTQLFQESLGSKDEDLEVKTVTNINNAQDFFSLKLNIAIEDKIVYLMSRMYFFQVFVAFYSACKQVNFVTQEFVEKYKNAMRELEAATDDDKKIESSSLDNIVNEVEKNIKSDHQFIEIVLYFYPSVEDIKQIKDLVSQKFNKKVILTSVGSDWNHQSYQAAFGGKDTFYILLTRTSYKQEVPNISKELLMKNIDTLKLIAKATYLTIKDKCLLYSF